MLAVNARWHILYSDRTRCNATLQPEPLKQTPLLIHLCLLLRGLYLLSHLLPYTKWNFTTPMQSSFCTTSLPSYTNGSVFKSATTVLQTLVFLTKPPPYNSNWYCYSTTKPYLETASPNTLVSGLHRSARKRKVGIYCKVKPQNKTEKEPCHTTRVNLKCQVAVGITARVFNQLLFLQ